MNFPVPVMLYSVAETQRAVVVDWMVPGGGRTSMAHLLDPDFEPVGKQRYIAYVARKALRDTPIAHGYMGA